MDALRPPFDPGEDAHDVLRGMREAVGGQQQQQATTPAFHHYSTGEAKHILQALKKKELPFYWRLNLELLARYVLHRLGNFTKKFR